jgi:hypothetical protein
MLMKNDKVFLASCLVVIMLLFAVAFQGCQGVQTVPAKDISIETKCAAISLVVELGILPVLQNNPHLIPVFKEVADKALLVLEAETVSLCGEEAIKMLSMLVIVTGGDVRSAAAVRGLLRIAQSMFILSEETEELTEEVILYLRSIMDGVNFAIASVE